VAEEICDILGLKNSRRVTAALDPNENDVVSIDTPGGNPMKTIINQPGL
jgi:prophage antirepressor-like protein